MEKYNNSLEAGLVALNCVSIANYTNDGKKNLTLKGGIAGTARFHWVGPRLLRWQQTYSKHSGKLVGVWERDGEQNTGIQDKKKALNLKNRLRVMLREAGALGYTEEC